MNEVRVKLGSVLKQYRIEHLIQNDRNYKQVSILNEGVVVLRGEKIGREIGRKRQFIVDTKLYPNTLIFTRQLLLQGCIGIAPNEVCGCIVTENMPMFSIEGIEPDFLSFYLKTEWFKSQVRILETTGTAQKSLHERQFLELEIPLPSPSVQKKIITNCKRATNSFKDLEKEMARQQAFLQQLHQSILQEAVQGKLTKQNPTDETADKLLERIKAEKQQLIAAGQLKKEKQLPPITAEQIPFDLPKGWAWCRLGEIINLASGVTLGKSYKGKLFSVPYLRVANVQRGFVDTNKVKELHVPNSEIDKFALQKGDLVMIEGGDWDKVGRCAIWDARIDPCIHQNHIFRLRFYGNVSSHWAELFLNSPIARKYFESCSKQTTNLASINKTQLSCTLFPLPSLFEQKRIVAKAQQLLQTVRLLEEQVEESRTQALHLLEAVLKEAFHFSHPTTTTAR